MNSSPLNLPFLLYIEDISIVIFKLLISTINENLLEKEVILKTI